MDKNTIYYWVLYIICVVFCVIVFVLSIVGVTVNWKFYQDSLYKREVLINLDGAAEVSADKNLDVLKGDVSFLLDDAKREYVDEIFLSVETPFNRDDIDIGNDVCKTRVFLGFFEDQGDPNDEVSRFDYDRPTEIDSKGKEYGLKNLPLCTNGIILADTNGTARISESPLFIDLTQKVNNVKISNLKFLSDYRKTFFTNTPYYLLLEIHDLNKITKTFQFKATVNVKIKKAEI